MFKDSHLAGQKPTEPPWEPDQGRGTGAAAGKGLEGLEARGAHSANGGLHALHLQELSMVLAANFGENTPGAGGSTKGPC